MQALKGVLKKSESMIWMQPITDRSQLEILT